MDGHKISPLATCGVLAWVSTVCRRSINHFLFFCSFFKLLKISSKFTCTPRWGDKGYIKRPPSFADRGDLSEYSSFVKTRNFICKDYHMEIVSPDPVVKDLSNFK